MAVIEERLQRWAEWKSQALAVDGRDGEEAETDAVVSQLPQPLRATVERLYLQRAALPEHVDALGCPTWTITRRLGRSHRVLLEMLRSRQERAQRQNETADMLSRVRSEQPVDAAPTDA